MNHGDKVSDWYFPMVKFVCRKTGENCYTVGSLSEEGTEHELWWPLADFETEEAANKYLMENYPKDAIQLHF